MTDIDVAVVGGGVTGLASALAIAERGKSVCLLEQHPRLGHETSTRNSGVIHAGIYYPTGSLKARLCVQGASASSRSPGGTPSPTSVAGSSLWRHGEIPALEALAERALANDAPVEMVDRAFLKAKEPTVAGVAALWSPTTGRIEPETYVRVLARLAEAAGVAVLRAAKLTGARQAGDRVEVMTPHESIHATTIVNAAGLYADDVSRMLGGEAFTIPGARSTELAPGSRHLARHGLSVPHTPGHNLGVHLTKTRGTRARADHPLPKERTTTRGATAARGVDATRASCRRSPSRTCSQQLRHPRETVLPEEAFADF
jgi:L-2-hydroxyglutarate oxidase LhgO